MVRARTCIGCRQRESRSALLRLVTRGGAIVPDPTASLPGRGAWIHRDRACVEAASRRRAFGRAFRSVAELDASALATLWIDSDPSDRTG